MLITKITKVLLAFMVTYFVVALTPFTIGCGAAPAPKKQGTESSDPSAQADPDQEGDPAASDPTPAEVVDSGAKPATSNSSAPTAPPPAAAKDAGAPAPVKDAAAPKTDASNGACHPPTDAEKAGFCAGKCGTVPWYCGDVTCLPCPPDPTCKADPARDYQCNYAGEKAFIDTRGGCKSVSGCAERYNGTLWCCKQ